MNHEWALAAACRGLDTELFFSDNPDDREAAKSVCRRCPVVWPCLDEALATDMSIPYGIRAGLTANERRGMRETKALTPFAARRSDLMDLTRVLTARGLGVAEIAAEVGVTERTIIRWRNEFKTAA